MGSSSIVKPCPGCGVIPVPEARYCRVCGAPLKGSALPHHDAPISPMAQTMPLSGEGRPTNGLSIDEAQPGAANTTRVGQKEMESFLRRVQAENGDIGQPENATPPEQETLSAQTTTLDSQPPPAVPAEPVIPTSTPRVQIQIAPANVRARRMWQLAAVALACVALVAGALAFILSRKSNSLDNGTGAPISISDQKQLVSEKLAEAETLMAAGEFNHAVDVLRVAVKLDPANADAHVRLGNALEKSGSRTEAIGEYRAASQNDPNAVPAWRALASAQFEERLYNDAAESYRHLLVASGNALDDETWLAYADALRLAGRSEEARAIYQKTSGSPSAEVSRLARRRLSELGPATGEQARDVRGEGEPRTADSAATPTPIAAVATPTPAISSGSQVDFDSYYFQALNIVNGRDPKQIERADLLRALALFQRAAQGGTHRAEALSYVNRLGREYDRRKKW